MGNVKIGGFYRSVEEPGHPDWLIPLEVSWKGTKRKAYKCWMSNDFIEESQEGDFTSDYINKYYFLVKKDV